MEFYWNAAGITCGMLLLGSIVADKENYDIIFSNSNYSSKSVMKPEITNPLELPNNNNSNDIKSKEEK